MFLGNEGFPNFQRLRGTPNQINRRRIKNERLLLYLKDQDGNWYVSRHTSTLDMGGDWLLESLTLLECETGKTSVLDLTVCNHCLEVLGKYGTSLTEHTCAFLENSQVGQSNPLPLCEFQ